MDYLVLTEDLGIKMSIEDFDNLSSNRIHRLSTIQQKRLEYKAKRAEEERKRQEREALRKRIMKK